MSLNKVILMGNLTKDPVSKSLSGHSVVNFGIAVNRKYKQNEETKEEVCFVEITAWNRLAENCCRFLEKGSKVLVEGSLKYHSWENAEGQKRNKLDVTAQNVQFLSTPKDQGKEGTREDSKVINDNEDIPF